MTSRRSPWLAVVLLFGVLIAGCGSSGSSTTTSSSTPAASNTSALPKTVPTTGANSAILAAAVSACHSSIARDTTASSSLKAKLENICNEAGKGNLAGAEEAGRKVCVEVVSSSPIPSGTEKEEAVSACKHIDQPTTP